MSKAKKNQKIKKQLKTKKINIPLPLPFCEHAKKNLKY
jgi:hypothetical protein